MNVPAGFDPGTSVVLALAVRRWEAEVENAGRLASRQNGILGVIAMLLGLGLFRGPGGEPLEPVALVWIARGLLTLSVLQVLVALGLVLWIRSRPARVPSRRPPFASAFLAWTDARRHVQAVVVDLRDAEFIAIRVLTTAAAELYRRNAARKRLLDASQRVLFGAAVCAGFALSCYPYLDPVRGA